MEHIYKVTGMTRMGCKETVKKNLNSLKEIDDVEVSLEKGQAKIIMNKHVSIEELQRALTSKYIIEEESVHSQSSHIESEFEQSKFQQLKPLFIILFYITAASNLIHFENWSIQEVMMDFMGLFFIVFSFFKMLDLKGFAPTFSMYDPLAKKISLYGKVYPFVEIALGMMFLMRFEIRIALIATLIVLGITTFGVTRALLDKKSIRCACLGTALKLPMTEATFIENAIMIIMACAMLFTTNYQ